MGPVCRGPSLDANPWPRLRWHMALAHYQFQVGDLVCGCSLRHARIVEFYDEGYEDDQSIILDNGEHCSLPHCGVELVTEEHAKECTGTGSEADLAAYHARVERSLGWRK